MKDRSRKPNRLSDEKSPYLLQHTYNPVNWYPWGEEAFEKAKREDKPVFLSIGYSTCHWCHVMAHESFEDDQVAELLNNNFISVKVDKEERPDVDAVYMRVCQGMTGGGGWPLTIVMDGKQRPFFAGTYFPKRQRFQTPGLMDTLESILELWREERNRIENIQNKILEWLKEQEERSAEIEEESPVAESTAAEQGAVWTQIFSAARQLSDSFDEKYGGFGTKPKFPTPHNLMFLMRFYDLERKREQGDAELARKALVMAEKTFLQMYKGGIFDHVGGGFSRYSTDEQWLAPHFEKMLYDNSLLAIGYTEAYKLVSEPLYKEVAQRTLEYLLREMRQGGFCAAQDADSEGEEGKFYIFSSEEIKSVLGEEQGKAFNEYFGVTRKGNFEGKNILTLLKQGDSEVKREEKTISGEELEKMKSQIYDYRQQRYSLHKDDKILTAWNSMAIVAFAKAGRLLEDAQRYLAIAEETLAFLRKNLQAEEGSLFISWREGKAGGKGTLDEYAYYGWALLELYEATLKEDYAQEAMFIADVLKQRFWDEKKGGFFLTDKEGEGLIYRPKELYDGAVPSGNSVAAYFLIKLYKLTGEPEIGQLSKKQIDFIKKATKEYPQGHCFAMMALLMDSSEKSFLCENGICN